MLFEQFLDIRIGDTSQLFLKQDGHWIRLDTHELSKRIHHYKELTPKAQIRHMERWVNENALSILEIRSSSAIPNVYPSHCQSSMNILQAGAHSFLSGRKLFLDLAAGWILLADCLCGFHAAALRQAAPSLRFVLRFQTNSIEIRDALTTLVLSIIPRSEWKHKHYSIKRCAVLDCVVGQGSYHSVTTPDLKQYSRLKPRKKGHKIVLPFPYEDTVLLILHADPRLLREADPHIANAALFLFDSSAPAKQIATDLPASKLTHYDANVVADWKANREALASLMYWWWCRFDDEVTWASRIVQSAKRSFPTQSSPYIRVEVEPNALRQSVRYNVVCSFLHELEKAQLACHEDVTAMCEEAKILLAPPSTIAPRPRYMEDPDVFIELMKEIVAKNTDRLVPEDMPFRLSDKPMAAWRRIKEDRVLVFPEETWVDTYSKAARAAKGIDCSLMQSANWASRIQKKFCEAGLIKSPSPKDSSSKDPSSKSSSSKSSSSGSRYRYNLLQIEPGNKIYVVAVLVEKLGL